MLKKQVSKIQKNLFNVIKCVLLIKVVFFFFIAESLAWQKLQAVSKTVIKENSNFKVYRNLRYAEKPGSIGNDTSSDRTLDLYIPAVDSKDNLPVVLFIHGGGFSGGDKKSTEAFCSKLSSFGYAVVSINYTLYLKHNKISGASCSANMSKGLPVKGGFNPGLQTAIEYASEDARSALKWVRENAEKYKLNSSLIAISGGSAGAITALHTAYVSKQKILPIKAVVNLWGGLENVNFIKRNMPPLLTYHGDQDKLIHVEYAYALEDQMKKTGNSESILSVMEGKGHARYDIITNEKTEEIVAFLRKTLK